MHNLLWINNQPIVILDNRVSTGHLLRYYAQTMEERIRFDGGDWDTITEVVNRAVNHPIRFKGLTGLRVYLESRLQPVFMPLLRHEILFRQLQFFGDELKDYTSPTTDEVTWSNYKL